MKDCGLHLCIVSLAPTTLPTVTVCCYVPL